MKKAVMKLEFHNEKTKTKAMRTVCLSGVDSISMDMKEKKLTVVGDVDPVHMVCKLRKLCHTEIITVGPSKEPEKGKDDQPKKKDQKKRQDHVVFNPYIPIHYHDPNCCVIS